MRRSLPLAVLASAALAFAGCGDDDKSEGDGGAPTKATYIEQADELCRKTNDEGRKLNAEVQKFLAGGDVSALKAAAPGLDEAHALGERSLAEFKRIPRPAGDEQQLDKMFAAYDAQVAMLGKLADAARSGNGQAFRTQLLEQTSAVANSHGQAQAYGFEECGQGTGG